MRRRRPFSIVLAAAGMAAAVLAAIALALGGCAASSAGGRTVAPGGPDAAAPSVGTNAAVRSTNRLALALLGRLGGSGNAVLSPYSIETALAMVDQGAAGTTAQQLAGVLGTPDAAALAASNGALAARLTTSGGRTRAAPRLDVADALWLQSGLSLERRFRSTLAASFGAPPQTADFAAAPEAARAAVNAWVAAHTARLIRDLMPEGSITAQTSLVLANAIHLEARWAQPFQHSLTAPGWFHPDGGARRVQVPFMTQGAPATLPYGHGPGWRAIELPYRDSTLSMLAILPRPGTLRAFERTLTPTALTRIERSLVAVPVAFHMPKLSLGIHADLIPALSALGMPIAFTDAADFSRIVPHITLKIQAVEHGAVLRVDEAGTVAAAATGISLEPTSAQLPGATLTLDHPFLLVLRDRATGAILFAARVADPARG
jgi:serpin B